MFKRLRIAVLLYILLFVAAAQFFTDARATDWDAPLWVDVYTVAGDGDPRHAPLHRRLARERVRGRRGVLRGAKRSATASRSSNRSSFRIVGEHTIRRARRSRPERAVSAFCGGACACAGSPRGYGGRTRGRAATSSCSQSFTSRADGVALDRSTALEKGLIAVANLFADRDRARHEPNRARARAAAHAARDRQIFADLERAALSRRLRRARSAAAVAADESRVDGRPHSARRATRGHAGQLCARSSSARRRRARSVGRAADTRDTIARSSTFRLGTNHGPSAQQDLHAHRRRRDDWARQWRARRQIRRRVEAFGDVDETNSALGLLLDGTGRSARDPCDASRAFSTSCSRSAPSCRCRAIGRSRPST